MTTFDPTAIIDTGGWDMVIGLPLAMINTALNAQKLDLSFRFTTPNAGQTITLTGAFAPWSIGGGSGQDLTLIIPIASGTASVTGAAASAVAVPAGTYDLAGISITVSTRLAFEQPSGTPGISRLVFAFDEATSQVSTQTGAPTGGKLVEGGETLPVLLQDVLPDAIAACLAANIATMDLVFATLTEGVSPSGPTAPANPRWEYAVASQQDCPSQAVALFYAASAGTTLSSAIPAPIGTNDTACITLLSSEAALRSVVVPILVYALDHVRAPMPEAFGIGPVLLQPPPATNAIDPSLFSVTLGAAGTNTATIAAIRPIDLALGGWSEGATATLTTFTCAVAGNDLTISFTAQSSVDPGMPYATSRSYRLEFGQEWSFGQSSFGFHLWPTGSSEPENEIQHMIFGAIDLGLDAAILPFTFALFGNQTMQPQEGYLNGGLGLAGPIGSATS